MKNKNTCLKDERVGAIVISMGQVVSNGDPSVISIYLRCKARKIQLTENRSKVLSYTEALQHPMNVRVSYNTKVANTILKRGDLISLHDKMSVSEVGMNHVAFFVRGIKLL